MRRSRPVKAPVASSSLPVPGSAPGDGSGPGGAGEREAPDSDRRVDSGPGARDSAPGTRGRGLVGGARDVAVVSAAVLLTAAVVWLAVSVLVNLAVLTIAVAVALLLAALLTPVVSWLCRQGTPSAVAALVGMLLVLAVPVGTGAYAWARASDQSGALSWTVGGGLETVERWLVQGPLSLPAQPVESLSSTVMRAVQRFAGGTGGGLATGMATTALQVGSGAVLALFLLFFLLKDGPQMWRWVVSRLPQGRAEVVDDAGRHAWSTLTSYGVSVVLVALIDAVLIGAGLFLLGVPLALALSLLIFVGAFVPFLGALVTGGLAVLVTLSALGAAKALLVLGLVVLVQQLEGNLLQPLIAGRAVALHPVVIIVAVTCGLLLFGIPGGIVAVPVVAVGYTVAERLAARR